RRDVSQGPGGAAKREGPVPLIHAEFTRHVRAARRTPIIPATGAIETKRAGTQKPARGVPVISPPTAKPAALATSPATAAPRASPAWFTVATGDAAISSSPRRAPALMRWAVKGQQDPVPPPARTIIWSIPQPRPI